MNNFVNAQTKTDDFLKELLLQQNDSLLNEIILHSNKYRVQIIYTQINRDRNNSPHFKNFYFHVDPSFYFNPASTVKMPLAFLALEKLNKLSIESVDKYTSMLTDSNQVWESSAYKDTTSKNGYPSIAQYIKKAFLVSDNDAYNRLYQFLGQQTINRRLHQMGYEDARIIRQFLGLTEEQNRYTNGIRFIDSLGNVLYQQPPAYNSDQFDFSHIIKLGKAHWDKNDQLVSTPMDFTKQNNISLEDLQQILQSVLFPKSVLKKQQFYLNQDDYRFLYKYLSQYPSETNYPKYDSSVFYDSYVKFFFRGNVIPDYLRIFNKVGWSYGFLTDVSYVVDFRHQIEYMLSAVIYVNSNEILNDGNYDYEKMGYPFFRKLGRVIYEYEKERTRNFKPDLSRFKMEYDVRKVEDHRPTVKKVAN